VQAVADEGDAARFAALVASEDEYEVMCGVVGLGRLLAERVDPATEADLRASAKDHRWRVREGVAMALQRLGDVDMSRLLDLADSWADDPDPFVQRAAVAGVCEPRLLKLASASIRGIELCRRVTDALVAWPPAERSGEAARTLRQALGYCWSVAVAANPSVGLPAFREIENDEHPDAVWIARENRKKARLKRVEQAAA
jgi:hypothetical protein